MSSGRTPTSREASSTNAFAAFAQSCGGWLCDDRLRHIETQPGSGPIVLS